MRNDIGTEYGHQGGYSGSSYGGSGFGAGGFGGSQYAGYGSPEWEGWRGSGSRRPASTPGSGSHWGGSQYDRPPSQYGRGAA